MPHKYPFFQLWVLMVAIQDRDDSSLEENLNPQPRMMPSSMLPISRADPEASTTEINTQLLQCKEVHS